MSGVRKPRRILTPEWIVMFCVGNPRRTCSRVEVTVKIKKHVKWLMTTGVAVSSGYFSLPLCSSTSLDGSWKAALHWYVSFSKTTCSVNQRKDKCDYIIHVHGAKFSYAHTCNHSLAKRYPDSIVCRAHFRVVPMASSTAEQHPKTRSVQELNLDHKKSALQPAAKFSLPSLSYDWTYDTPLCREYICFQRGNQQPLVQYSSSMLL